ncbi:hypothetical protein F2P81_012881 [Scophthalmus maximus]|uniref:Uncharacterized protein n=1 Tax=Scophthalmus maximus TaxID=52904 RepID=A0A6A4SM06_SCOMX|nr:hypothetical protein F2P81_012881 [Scophthalmus maximus]
MEMNVGQCFALGWRLEGRSALQWIMFVTRHGSLNTVVVFLRDRRSSQSSGDSAQTHFEQDVATAETQLREEEEEEEEDDENKAALNSAM